MPVLDTTNAQVPSANARAADVAEKAINEIMPEMQQRYMSAFRPQGVQCIHYNRLNSGRKCNCQASQKQINGLLGRDGKADIGTINSIITGNTDFGVTPYNFNQGRATDVNAAATSPYAPLNKFQGVFDVLSADTEIPMADLLGGREAGVGDNGAVEAVTIDEMVADFDAGSLGFTDVACPICFGTGFVGGFSPFHGHRQVLTVMDLQINPTGSLDLLKAPFVANASGFNVIVKLPRGAIGVDIFRVLNGAEPTGAIISIDGNIISSINQILTYCDGRQHLINASNLNLVFLLKVYILNSPVAHRQRIPHYLSKQSLSRLSFRQTFQQWTRKIL
jgi:hypothetical protein